MASHRSRKQCNFLAEVQTGYGGLPDPPDSTTALDKAWLSKQQVEDMIEDILCATPGVIDRVSSPLPEGAPSGLAERIINGNIQSGHKIA